MRDRIFSNDEYRTGDARIFLNLNRSQMLVEMAALYKELMGLSVNSERAETLRKLVSAYQSELDRRYNPL